VNKEDADLHPAVDVVDPHEDMVSHLIGDNVSIMEMLAQLGANPKSYRRERSRAVKTLVSEIYSAPRVTQASKLLPSLGILPGFAFDLTTVNKDGHNWDFTKEAMRQEARMEVIEGKPLFLIGSPACTDYCSWQVLNAQKFGWPEGEVERRMIASDVHLAFVAELYKIQMDGGRYFLHENPDGARSWSRRPMTEIVQDARVQRITGDQCQYGQESFKGDPVKKPTGWLSNSPEILKKLEKRCRGRRGECTRPRGGRHASASGRVAREAAVYPFQLCRTILEGCRNQLRKDGKLHDGMHGIQGLFEEDSVRSLQPLYLDALTGEELKGEEAAAAERVFNLKGKAELFHDSVTGQPLEPMLVKAARKLEME